MTDGYWGDQTYGISDQTRVPVKSARCKSKPHDQPRRHVCREHRDHKGDHRCICNKRWTAKGELKPTSPESGATS